MNDTLSKDVLNALEPFVRALAMFPAWATESDNVIVRGYSAWEYLNITIMDFRRLARAVEAYRVAVEADDERKGGFICVDPGFRNRILEEVAKGKGTGQDE